MKPYTEDRSQTMNRVIYAGTNGFPGGAAETEKKDQNHS